MDEMDGAPRTRVREGRASALPEHLRPFGKEEESFCSVRRETGGGPPSRSARRSAPSKSSRPKRLAAEARAHRRTQGALAETARPP